jgi:hypothetical protein
MRIKKRLRNFLWVAITSIPLVTSSKDLSVVPDTNSAYMPIGPRIEFASSVFDFGRVESGKIVSHNFIFTNIGDQTLEISDVPSSCGCTTATNWDRRIDAGKTGIIPVLFNSGGIAGPVTKNLWVICNDPVHPNPLLTFTATIWKLIDAIPAIATFTFGPDFQTNQTRVIRLVNNLQEPVTLSAPVCTNHSFKTTLKTVETGKEFELEVTVVPPLGPGSVTAPITIKSSSSKMPTVTVTAYAMVQSALTVTPPKIVLSATSLSESEQFIVKIQNNGNNPLALSEPAITAKGVSLQLKEIQPGRLFNLIVNFPKGFRSQHGRPITVSMKSNHQQFPAVTVPVIQLESSIAD